MRGARDGDPAPRRPSRPVDRIHHMSRNAIFLPPAAPYNCAPDRFGMRTPILLLVAVVLAVCAPQAHASFLSGDALDALADWIAITVLIVVPIIVIVVFWLVHVLPERFAEKYHHPQAKAIQVLCLLSLVFGGLLWPIAWLWAFTRPVTYKMAYGTDKHETWHEAMGAKARAGELLGTELEHLRTELDPMAAKGPLTPSLRQLRADLDALVAAPTDRAGAT